MMSIKEKLSMIRVIMNIFVMILSGLYIFMFGRIIDAAVLLEKRYPSYWNVIGKYTPYELMVSVDHPDWCEAETTRENLLLNYEWFSGNEAGVDVLLSENSVMLNGEALNSTYIGVIKDYIFLEEGTYYISAGYSHIKSRIYFEGWYNGERITKVNHLGSGYFVIKGSDTEYRYGLTMDIKKGTRFENNYIRPRLVKVSDCAEDLSKLYVVNAFFIPYDKWHTLTDKELEIANNKIRYQYTEVPWVSIILDNGYGIQFINGSTKKGLIDSVGRVNGR